MAVAVDLWETIAQEAADESRLWGEALKVDPEREPVFSPLGEARYALGLETIYEGYLLHYGRPRLFAPVDEDTALLLGDYLYAHGLVRIAEAGPVEAVTDAVWGEVHRGMDYMVPAGTVVQAPAAGTVLMAATLPISVWPLIRCPPPAGP